LKEKTPARCAGVFSCRAHLANNENKTILYMDAGECVRICQGGGMDDNNTEPQGMDS